MIELPAALAPWAAELAVLPTDLALTLAPWVGRLALAIGPMSESRNAATDEPDGYAGLARRGSYERLLTAEWGVAELFPDEFVRRAAAGEHLFLERARRGPHGALRSIAIVSAGPGQLGAPRLAHLAALIVLARRAAAAGASFAWGVLEDPAHALVDGVDGVAIRRLLDARTARGAGPGAIDGWRAALGGDRALDWWCVGASADVELARRAGASCLAVRDVLEPGARALDALLDRRGRAARIRLELPAPDLCARLLRDPLARGGGSRVATVHGAAREIRFSGRKLLVGLTNHAIVRWPIPNSPREPLGQPRRWEPPPGLHPLAIGVAGRVPIAVLAGPSHVHQGVLEVRHGASPHVGRVTVPPSARAGFGRLQLDDPELRIGVCGLIKLRRGIRPALVIELASHLIIVDGLDFSTPQDKPVAALPLSGAGVVLATSFAPDTVRWAEHVIDREHQPGGVVHVRYATDSGSPSLVQHEAGLAPPVAFFGAGAFALGKGDGAWLVAAEGMPSATLHTPLPVVGAGRVDGKLAVLVRDEARLSWLSAGGRKDLPPASAPIAAVAVCTERPEVAWLTVDGEISVVYSMTHAATLMRLTGGKHA